MVRIEPDQIVVRAAQEAIGDATDDDDLKREGKADKASGKVKQKVDDAVDKVKDAFHRD